MDAILETWFPGNQAGNAIVDVLFGQFNPQGKLTVSFPRTVGQVPIFYNHKNTGRPEGFYESVFITKYLDSPNQPLFPFGYGLSYTTFEYSEIQMEDNLRVSVRDYGRGIPLGSLVDAVSMLNTGGKYDTKAFKKSVGLNGVGAKAVNALSSRFIARSVRDGQMREAVFAKGD